MNKQSLYREAFRAAEAYRESMAQRVSDDMLNEAVSHWNQELWWQWASRRVAEHLLGDAYWEELDGNRFATVGEETPRQLALLREMQDIEGRLHKDELMPYQERLKLIDRWSLAANRLLD